MADLDAMEGRLDKSYLRRGGKAASDKRGNAILRNVTPARGEAPAKRSDRQKERLKRWALIKKSMICAQRLTDGYTSCMGCGQKNPRKLECDHIESTGRGGDWVPENAQLLCAGPGTNDCHGQKHGARRAS